MMNSDSEESDQPVEVSSKGKDISTSQHGGDNTTINDQDKELLREQMKDMFATIIKDINKQVLTVSKSQSELDKQLDELIAVLDSIKIDEKLTGEINSNAKRISSLKSRLTLVHTILSNSSARCSRTLVACGAAVSSLNPATSTTEVAPLSSHDST